MEWRGFVLIGAWGFVLIAAAALLVSTIENLTCGELSTAFVNIVGGLFITIVAALGPVNVHCYFAIFPCLIFRMVQQDSSFTDV